MLSRQNLKKVLVIAVLVIVFYVFLVMPGIQRQVSGETRALLPLRSDPTRATTSRQSSTSARILSTDRSTSTSPITGSPSRA